MDSNSHENLIANRILLVADGEPRHGGLSQMKYSYEIRPILTGFFTDERELLIRAALIAVEGCSDDIGVYVMTTGHGALSVSDAATVYNVPGQKSIRMPKYQKIYEESLMDILAPDSSRASKVAIVYYAGKSKDAFREGVFDLLAKLQDRLLVERGLELTCCMYGTRQHQSDQWDGLCDLFRDLVAHDQDNMNARKAEWLTWHSGNSPFFEWF